jgi:hypothetical protein
VTVAAGADRPEEVDAHSEVGVRNSQPEGIGRVANLGDTVAWNNLGRNIVFADRHWQPIAVYGSTSFAHDDVLSQYDLDVHAILRLAGEGQRLVVTLNHLGSVLAFAAEEVASAGRPRSGLLASGSVKLVEPVISTSFADDLERTVAVGARLVSSRPGHSPGGGLLVSEPLHGGFRKPALDSEVALEGWGRVTALGTFRTDREELVAVGGESRVTLVGVDDGLGRRRFEVDLPLRAAAFAWDGRLLWAVGSELAETPIDDYRWEDLRGGRYAGLDPSNGRTVVAGRLPHDVAWGNGGVAVVVAGGRLCAVGRTGSLHWLSDPRTGRFSSTAPLGESSRGIAHAASVGDRVLFGFNRGGYRLHASEAPPQGHRA